MVLCSALPGSCLAMFRKPFFSTLYTRGQRRLGVYPREIGLSEENIARVRRAKSGSMAVATAHRLPWPHNERTQCRGRSDKQACKLLSFIRLPPSLPYIRTTPRTNLWNERTKEPFRASRWVNEPRALRVLLHYTDHHGFSKSRILLSALHT